MRGGPHLPGACLAYQKSTAVMTVRCAQTLGLASLHSAMALDTTVSTMSSPPDRTSLVCARPLRRIGLQSPTPTGAFRSARRPQCGHETSCCPATLCGHGTSLSLSSPSAPLKIQSTRLLTTGLFNPELCGGVAPHEFLFVMWLSVLVAIIGPLMPHCRHSRERRPMPPSHAVSLDLSRISPS